MIRRTGDPLPDTHDTRIVKGEAADDRDTKIFPANESTAETVEIGDSGPRRHIVGSKLSSGEQGRIGGYHIIRKLGEGGMGIVYEAEQQQPRRLVALKVMRGGLYASEYYVRMFERETQALARLKHPGIVSIYEAGRFEDGQVFFAMELLQGTSLVDFVEEHGLSVNDKLELFSKICEIVNYAHQRGVIHRDLKPQNIFVADDPDGNSLSSSSINRLTVKILDFGLARIIDPDFAGATDISQIGHIKGTLNYMSPEQLSGNPADVDVRSDVYALGVMLYEVLAGRLPYDIRQVTVPEAMRIISQQAPAPLGRSGGRSTAETRKTISRIDADVETIVLKALEKEPDRRYQSVAAMLDDITRYLTDQPILARPASAFYQFRKLVLRHKTASASLAGLFLILLAFGIAMAAQNARITNERNRAWAAQQMAEEQEFQAEQARDSEQKQRLIAEQNLARAEEQQRIAEHEKAEAERARKAELEQRVTAETNLKRAEHEKRRAEQQTKLAKKHEIVAREQKTLAEKGRAEAEEQREIASTNAEINRRLFYNSQMNLAAQAWKNADIPSVQQILNNQIPTAGQQDLRGFEWYYLWKLANSERRTFNEFASSVRFLPDGESLVLSGYEQISHGVYRSKMSIVAIADGGEIARADGRAVLGVLNDGRLLTVPAEQIDHLRPTNQLTSIEFFDPSSGNVSNSGAKVATAPYPPLFSPDGKTLVERTRDSLKLRVRENGALLHTFTSDGLLIDATYSLDGRILAIINSPKGAGNRSLIVWDVSANTLVAEIVGDRSDFRAVALSPDGRIVASKGFDDTLTKWNVASKARLFMSKPDDTEPFFGSGPHKLLFSPDGRIIADVRGRVVVLWLPVGKRLIKGYGGPVSSIAFSPDSRYLATAGSGAPVKIWSISDTGSDMISGYEPSLSYDGKTIATAGRNSVELWSAETAEKLADLVIGKEEMGSLRSPKFVLGGEMLAVIRSDLPTNPLISAGQPNSETRRALESVLPTSLEVPKSRIDLWDINSKTRMQAFEEGAGKLSLSPDGRLMAVVNRMGTNRISEYEVNVWDLRTRMKILSLGKGFSAVFSPDGKTLAVASDQSVRVISVPEGKETGSFSFRVSSILADSIVFSPDGKLISTIVGTDVILSDYAGLREKLTLKGHSGYVSSMTFSPDGRRIITSSPQDRTLIIWDVATGQKLMTLDVENATTILFGCGGQCLFVSGGRGTQIWRAATQEDVAKPLEKR